MTRYRVRLVWRDGNGERIDARPEESILDAAERAGVALPFGCRTGACATCTGRLLDGEVEHARPPRALSERHLAEGYVLLCVARPRSECRVEVGANVARDLVGNPWK